MSVDIQVERGAADSYAGGLLLLFSFDAPEDWEEPVRKVDLKWGGFLSTLMKQGDFKGELFESRLLYTHGTLPVQRVLLMGLGKKAEFDLEKWRGASSKAGKAIRDSGTKTFAFPIKTLSTFSEEELSESFITGFILGTYQFNEFKTLDRDKMKQVDTVILLGETAEEVRSIEKGAQAGKIISEAVTRARDLVNGPANQITPTALVRACQEIARTRNMDIHVMDVGEAEAMGMGAFVAVAKGSHEPGKFITLEYNRDKGLETIALVGKGITFDSGGISIKPSERMERMKDDMSGAAAVIGTMEAASRLQLPLHLVGIIPATENLPDGKAYKPGDILKSLSGQTVEVISTDAEGRLILCDALTYSLRYQPKAIIDLATLTGACVVALGDYVTGLFGNDDDLVKRIEEASKKTGEKVWRLPIWDEYFDYIKSDSADFKNVGTRAAGAIIGGVFLNRFVQKSPWVHLDIAGPASIDKDQPYVPKGGTGVGVRLLVQLLRDWTKN
jgi:leucyl aminopeptidase